MLTKQKKFDVFLSYKSQDVAWVQKLKHDLQVRGVKVWLDKDDIRPGDLFVEALESGIETSKNVVIVVTSESVNSGWVRRERARALALASSGETHLIPILYGDTELPGFLADIEFIDFRDQSKYDQNLNKLIWPGLTGQRILFVGVGHVGGSEWNRFENVLKQEGISFWGVEDIDRVKWPGYERSYSNLRLDDSFLERNRYDPTVQVIIVVDPFEGRPLAGHSYVRNSPLHYFDFILHHRNATRGLKGELVFILFYNSQAWESVSLDEPSNPLRAKGNLAYLEKNEVARRFKHYFTVYQDVKNDEDLLFNFRDVWVKVQREIFLGKTLSEADKS